MLSLIHQLLPSHAIASEGGSGGQGAWEPGRSPPAENGHGAPERDPTKIAADIHSPSLAALHTFHSDEYYYYRDDDDGDHNHNHNNYDEDTVAKTPKLFIDLSEFTPRKITTMAADQAPPPRQNGRAHHQHPAEDHEWKALPPSKLGEYTVIRDIAEGTFGKVKSES